MSDVIPVGRLEKLWRRYRQARGKAIAEARRAKHWDTQNSLYGQSLGFWYAAADLRKLIDEAKGEDDG